MAQFMLTCPNCGATNNQDARFCRNCGQSMAPSQDARPRPAASVQLPDSVTSIQASLGRLGIPLSCGQLTSFGLAVLAGLILPRFLPLIFPIFYPILNRVFSGSPDSFNTFAMTSLTCLCSFGIAFLGSFFVRSSRRRSQ